jgi:hypothetical protein
MNCDITTQHTHLDFLNLAKQNSYFFQKTKPNACDGQNNNNR